MLRIHRLYERLLCCFMTVVMIVSLTACGAGESTNNAQTATASPAEETSSVTGIVISNDTEERQIQIRELDSTLISTLTYTAESVLVDEYDQNAYGEDAEVGMILTAEYRRSDAHLVYAYVPEDVWVYRDVGIFAFSSEKEMLTVAGEKYQYSDMTYYSADGVAVDQAELNEQDVLTVRGIGISVYSVVRTSGHGYIRLENYSDFVGGIAQVSASLMVTISENMLITAAEGTYELTLCKNSMAATKTVTVVKDEEVTVDFSDYTVTAKNVGTVTFDIEPDGAALYLNSTAVDYTNPVSLSYGKYNISVSLTGYSSYSGVLSVAEASRTVHIDLIEATAETEDEEDEDSSSETEDSDEEDEDDDTDTVTKTVDTNHKITVSAPEGVEVYLDNVYKGLSPVSFTKVIGSQTITLSANGYVTKSYSVDILDDDENAEFSFPELVAEDEDE